ncbi:tautomerase family protein [Lysinibacillus sp. NPDC094177]|uniref:tautomerase family protein n=1 Tax=Lysinibacillus sp. NPDC094177 TaxID=3390580 RepID=UPI003CFF7C79
MPFATIKTFKGALTNEQKQELHRRFADLMVEIEGKGNEEFRKFVILAIEEEEPINLGIGGIRATEDLMKRITGN